MLVSLVAAMDEAGGIGFRGSLPWRLSTDLKQFKALTMGHCVIMGRKTYEAIGHPLPGRVMIVISRRMDFHAEGCRVAHSLDQALELARQAGEGEVFVIGGAEVYAQALPLAGRLYLRRVHTRVQADVFFPVYEEAKWREISASFQPSGEKDEFDSTLRVFERIS